MPFRDGRRPYVEPTLPSVFRMFTTETSASLRVGLILPAKVATVSEKWVNVRLDSGLRGSINIRNTHLDPRSESCKAHFWPDQIVTCCVLEIKRDRFELQLAALPNDAAIGFNAPPLMDAAADAEAALRIQRENAESAALAASRALVAAGATAAIVAAASRGALTLRTISHPSFMNATRDEVTAVLRDRPVYEFMFRPSSQGTDHLTLTWKLMEPCHCVHIDIQESDKDRLQPTALGRRLSIDGGRYVYADIDEVIHRHIEPMAQLHRSLRAASKVYRDATQDLVDAELRERLKTEPGRIPYAISPNVDRFGMYTISYLRSSNVHHELVTVTPAGFKWRTLVCPSWHKLVDDFKRHCRTDPRLMQQQAAAQERQQQAAAAAAAGGGASAASGSRFGPSVSASMAAPSSSTGAGMVPRPPPAAYPPAPPLPPVPQPGAYPPPVPPSYPGYPPAGGYGAYAPPAYAPPPPMQGGYASRPPPAYGMPAPQAAPAGYGYPAAPYGQAPVPVAAGPMGGASASVPTAGTGSASSSSAFGFGRSVYAQAPVAAADVPAWAYGGASSASASAPAPSSAVGGAGGYPRSAPFPAATGTNSIPLGGGSGTGSGDAGAAASSSGGRWGPPRA